MEGIQTFKGSWPWPWPWIRPYGIPSCITHRPLPIYQISLKSKKLFVDGRTDVRTDIFRPLILLGRLSEVDLIIGAHLYPYSLHATYVNYEMHKWWTCSCTRHISGGLEVSDRHSQQSPSWWNTRARQVLWNKQLPFLTLTFTFHFQPLQHTRTWGDTSHAITVWVSHCSISLLLTTCTWI